MFFTFPGCFYSGASAGDMSTLDFDGLDTKEVKVKPFVNGKEV